jgi:two-component system, cell cycle sensor histidine kinase and response regulator CckA
MTKKRILIVEDDPQSREYLQYLLTRTGYEVVAAEDGANALEQVQANHPDLIITDILMPTMDGFTLVQKLRTDPATAKIPIIFYSATYEGPSLKSLIAKGDVAQQLQKPAAPHILLDAVEQAFKTGALQGTFDPSLFKEEQIRVLSKKVVDKVQELTIANADLESARARLEAEVWARTESEAELRKSRERYRMLFDHNPHPMWVFDLDTLKFLAVNEAATRKYGYTREEFLGMSIDKIRPAEDLPQFRESLAKITAGADHSSGWRHITKSGDVIEVEISAHTLEFEDRRAQLVVAFDVTDRNRAQSNLLKSEARFATAFQASPLPMTISTKKEGKYVDVNSAFAEVYGYTRQEMIGHAAVDLGFWVDSASRTALIAELEKSGSIRNRHATVFAKDRKQKQVILFIETVDIEGEPCILAVTQDVTESLLLEEQLRRAQKMEAIGLLAGGIAHDCNNMLGVIMGNAELVAEKVKEDPKLSKRLDEIKIASQRAAALTGQLLAFSRQQVLSPQVINLNDIVRETVRMLDRLIGEDIRVHVGLAEGLWNVTADSGQVQQVLLNLAVNARDAMPKGGSLKITTENIELDETYARTHFPVSPGEYVVFIVADTGIGMDAETQARIFEPFFTTKTQGKGTGLGLATTYGIVKQSGGFIWVYSELGKGTTFKIYLPRTTATKGNLNRSTTPTARSAGGETIAVAEDQEQYMSIIVDALTELGYNVIPLSAEGGPLRALEGLAAIPNVLLTDVVMPEITGVELATKARARFPNIKVMYMSGYTSDAIDRTGGLGADSAFLQKPFSPNQLAQKIREVLDGR